LKSFRYVGNDSVHIVWSENDREYRAGTITSQFNFVHIIIYPLRNGLFRIQILKKKGLVKFFGPLINGMVISKQILVPLIRYTSINSRKCMF